jgi:hypothetical protein
MKPLRLCSAASSDVTMVRYPDGYMDPRGAVMWRRVQALVAQLRQVGAA